MSKLPERNSRSAIFNFHLLSIAETDFYEFFINGEDIQVNKLSQLLYRNKFIVDKKEKDFIVDFVTSEKFQDRLNIYNKLHDSYKNHYNDLLIDFYSDVINNYKKRNLHSQSYNESVSDIVEKYLPYDDREMFDILGMYTSQNEQGEIELKSVVFQGKTLEFMLSNQQFISSLKQWFKKWYFIDAPIKLMYDDSHDHEFEQDEDEHYDDYYE